MNGGEGRARKHLPWGLPTVVARPPASVKLLQAAPDPPTAHRLGTASQLMAGWVCSLFSPAVASLRDRRAPSVDLGVQQRCMEGKEGPPPHVPLIWGNPDT